MILLTELSTEEVLKELQKNPGLIRTYLEGLAPSLLSFLFKVVVALLILVIGSRIVKALVRTFEKSMKRGHAETGAITFLCSVLKWALYLVLIMIVLSQFGVTTSSVVAILGSAGLTAGLALQGPLSNFAGGVLIMLLKPFVVGDYISDSGSGKEGTVSELTIFYTKLVTPDNKMIVIPNGDLSSDSITNYTMMDKRRVELIVGVDYRTKLDEAKNVLLAVVAQEEGVLDGEPVDVYVDELAASSVNMGVRVWVKTEEYWQVRWRLVENIKNALDEAGIQIPFPQLTVQVSGSDRGE